MHPSVGVAAHGVASGDSAGEVSGVPHHNPRESCCDLHLWWNCIRGTSDITCNRLRQVVEYIGETTHIIVDQRVHKINYTLNKIAEYM